MTRPAEDLARAVRQALRQCRSGLGWPQGDDPLTVNPATMRASLQTLDQSLATWEAPGGEREAWEGLVRDISIAEEQRRNHNLLNTAELLRHALARLEGK